ncbi:SPV056 putative myristylated protein [Swinepox virus]|uniref:SPV056 putative myristylated protein n=1 Tax=Swinepox virus (strain Swine/Nebraska/17077-99/1999) TaxID=300880 RepID=Q8V3N8_SWPV1|nr:poxvirus myristoylprotein [Swinepox virus]AAL69795.1 SPV056 putative myristylated protein [Swinepox virus]UED36580.1 poxvirus myristoylprotein [Swinepox virus]UED36729.1 poxvirus myristoylprotein [Swinepox virus]UUA44246.1 SPV056 [Swinepox virus]
MTDYIIGNNSIITFLQIENNMGSSFAVPEDAKRQPLPRKPTYEMNLDVNKMYELIASISRINDEIYIGKVDDYTLNQLRYRFPEFLFIESGPGKLYKAVRSKYTNDERYCCKNLKLQSYWKDDNGVISILYRPNTILNSCDPDLLTSTLCDNLLLSLCNDAYKSVSESNLCDHWISTLLERYNISSNLIDTIINICSKNANLDICQSFIRTLRIRNTEKFDNIIDYILYSQSDIFKQKYMKCSYPTQNKIDESLKYVEKRECWDPECATGNINLLLTNNYRNLGLCNINRCNIGINYLNLDNKSKLRMSCGKDTVINKPINREKVIKHNMDHSFKLRIHELTILSILVMWILIVAI